jgi:hypothetical protein
MERFVDGLPHPLLLVENPPGPEPSASTAARRPHLLIAGTGRTGTSFLVRFLAKAGLDTQLSHTDEIGWDEAAQAGLEDMPLSALRPDLPYVLKQPWSYQMIDEILADPGIELQAAIVPVRNMVDAVSSRIVLQLRAMHEAAPWMAGLQEPWHDWGGTPGGAIYSLDPLDQARLLAVGFHHLIERLVQADIPIILLAFPRLAEDPDYLYARLRPVLPAEVTLEIARAAHRQLADRGKVRIEAELREAEAVGQMPIGRGDFPSLQTLNNIALRRELGRVREQLAQAERRALSLSARLSYGGLCVFKAARRLMRGA